MILFGFCSYFLKNPGKEWDTCVEEKKNKKEKTKIKKQKEDIERRRVGTCVKGKSPKKKKKRFWVGLNSLQITKILINFKGPYARVIQFTFSVFK